MTIAQKILALFMLFALVLGGISIVFTAQNAYQNEAEKNTSLPLAQVLERPDLQLYFYRKNEQKLQSILAKLLQPQAAIWATAYSNQGEILTQIDRTKAPKAGKPSFDAARRSASVAETTRVALGADGQEVGIGYWSSLFNSNSVIQLSIPVLSQFNPTDTSLSDTQIARAIFNPNTSNSSQTVIGYIHLTISQAMLRHNTGAAVLNALWWYVGFMLLLGAVALYLSRRISNSITQLTDLAAEVSSGNHERAMTVEGGPDISKIADLLNTVIGDSLREKSDAHLSSQILNLKVDEHSSALTEREQELNTAAQEISNTKKKLRKLAYFDSLTSLPNRRLFTEQLGLLLRMNERNKGTLALLLVNLENFKRINDSLGHSIGDLVLQEVALRLSQCLRGSDTVAYQKESNVKIDVSRVDGDEFTVVLNQLTSADDIGIVAQRLIDKLLEPMLIEGHELVISPHIGISVSPGDADQVQGLFTAASAAAQHAKDSRHARFVFYKPEMDAAGAERISLEADLRKAVERGELRLHYQPQIDTVSGSVTSAEALLRWQHPKYGLVPPHKFIALAEEIGFISELGDWVLVEACRQMKVFADKGLKLPKIAINVSAMQFSSTFTRRVREVLAKVKLPPSMLELGLAESIMTDNDGSTIEALRSLKQRGVYLSVDDFGTSYSPMHYLSRYPLDEIKIDRSFVANCDKDEGDANLLAAIVSIAASLKLHTVAEGVETEAQYRFLKQSGATVMQGYLFSKPVDATELEAMLAPWHFAEQIQRIA